MKMFSLKMFVAHSVLVAGFGVGVLNAAVGDVTSLNKTDLGRVEAVLTKSFKGKPSLQSGTKQELENGWKINCVAEVGSGGTFQLVVMTEKSMTLGYVESQKPVGTPPVVTKAPG